MSTEHEPQLSMIVVEVAFATPARQVLVKVEVPEACTVGEAINHSAIHEEFPGMVIDPSAVGIFGRRVSLMQELCEGDRVEIYRPLIADPKEARRRRALAEKDS